MAADAREALQLDRVIFVPAGSQPFKVATPPVAPGAERLEMVRIAVAGDPCYTVDDAEISRMGLSYTVDTLLHLATRNRGAELFLLLGEDAMAGFPQWRSPERIRELATLAVMARSGSHATGPAAGPEGVVTVSTRRVDVSSTEIRARLRDGKSVRGFVPEGVERFIEARGLYR